MVVRRKYAPNRATVGRGKINTLKVTRYDVGDQTKDDEVLNIVFVLHIWPVMVVI
jgi:hypothetical protein